MDKINKKIVFLAAILGAVTITLGAFGAHGLKELISAKLLQTFETGVRYQMYHTVAILIVGLVSNIEKNTQKWVVRFFLIGIILFSGSIYLLSLKDLLVIDTTFIAVLTPLGGLFFILGWLRLALGVYKM
ncbi:MAG: DUF423 domain-containing protein [Flavobacteriales bacterium]